MNAYDIIFYITLFFGTLFGVGLGWYTAFATAIRPSDNSAVSQNTNAKKINNTSQKELLYNDIDPEGAKAAKNIEREFPSVTKMSLKAEEILQPTESGLLSDKIKKRNEERINNSYTDFMCSVDQDNAAEHIEKARKSQDVSYSFLNQKIIKDELQNTSDFEETLNKTEEQSE